MLNKGIWYILLFQFIIIGCSFSNTPQLKDNSIIFNSEKEINIYLEKQLITNDTDSYYVKDEFEIINDWNRVVVIRKKYLNEGYDVELILYNFNGELISTTTHFGNFEVLLFFQSKKLVMIQKSQTYQLNKSFIYDLEGNLIDSIQHNFNVVKTGKSNNEQYFWVMSRKSRETKENEEPTNPFFPGIVNFHYLEIFNFGKGFIDGIEVYEFGNVEVNIGDIILYIDVPKPEMPG